jgi:polar amino acid transport system substrate-binding protein
MNINHSKKLSWKLILVMFVLLLTSSHFIFNYLRLPVDTYDFLLKGLSFIVVTACILFSLDLENKWFVAGWSLLGVSIFVNTLDELKFLALFDNDLACLEFIFEKFFLFIGIILITHGFYSTAIRQKQLLEELKYASLNDLFTNLPNRNFIIQELSSLIASAHKHSSLIGILCIDLDNFKWINDTFGHSFGDVFLQKIAQKLEDHMDQRTVLARLSGDEFVIVVHDIKDIDYVETLAKKIIQLIQCPIPIDKNPIHVTCSIGISVFPYDGCTVDTLIKNASIGMYRAKEQGRNRYSFYDNYNGESAVHKLTISEKIRTALNKSEFILHYQPKVRMKDNQMIGLEALVRWNHPELGLIYPDKFISIAEEAGLIKGIDELVLELASRQIREWIDSGVEPINISVNVSPDFFNEEDFIDRLDRIFMNIGIDPSYISLEITETLAIKNMKHTCNILNELRRRKIKILLDDFGKGYSSLSYLKELPVDILKIDKHFIDGISKNKKDEALIEAIITMAKALDVKVVSEGVETRAQMEFLNKLGCHEYQGYLFSKPVPMEDIEKNFFQQALKNNSSVINLNNMM